MFTSLLHSTRSFVAVAKWPLNEETELIFSKPREPSVKSVLNQNIRFKRKLLPNSVNRFALQKNHVYCCHSNDLDSWPVQQEKTKCIWRNCRINNLGSTDVSSFNFGGFFVAYEVERRLQCCPGRGGSEDCQHNTLMLLFPWYRI